MHRFLYFRHNLKYLYIDLLVCPSYVLKVFQQVKLLLCLRSKHYSQKFDFLVSVPFHVIWLLFFFHDNKMKYVETVSMTKVKFSIMEIKIMQ